MADHFKRTGAIRNLNFLSAADWYLLLWKVEV